jgi:hypothetical protein
MLMRTLRNNGSGFLTVHLLIERFEKLQAIQKSAVEEAIALTFGDSNAKKSVSVVGNTEKTFVL